ncbi:hypothetical protein STEG23_028203, partial [Scotinomys teguina]
RKPNFTQSNLLYLVALQELPAQGCVEVSWTPVDMDMLDSRFKDFWALAWHPAIDLCILLHQSLDMFCDRACGQFLRRFHGLLRRR